MTAHGRPSLVDQMLEIMYQALGERVGLLIQTNDVARAKAIFYAARTKAGDPSLAQLECRGSPLEGGEIIIVKGAKASAGTAQIPEETEE